jgi:predicted O-methyltransferase YrrM
VLALTSKIEIRIGPALETLRILEKEGKLDLFDMAFVDADKESLDGYYEGSLRLVRPGGLILFDNMLHHGKVADRAMQNPRLLPFDGSARKSPRTTASIVCFCPLGTE